MIVPYSWEAEEWVMSKLGDFLNDWLINWDLKYSGI